MKGGNFDPLYLDLGPGYVSFIGFIIFTGRGGKRPAQTGVTYCGQPVR